MVLVVLTHIAGFNLGVNTGDSNNFHYYFCQVRMPLFFFVSGFVFYKNNFVWNRTSIKNFLQKKFFVQIISPFIFLLFYINYKNIPFINAITDEFKAGYWFTFTLFFFFILYIVLKASIDKTKIKENTALTIILFIGFITHFIWVKGYLAKLEIPYSLLSALSMNQITYFIFFTLGICIKRHFNKFERLLDKSYLVVIAIALFFTINMFVDTTNLRPLISRIINLILSTSGIVITFAVFRKNEKFFASNNKIANTLKFIGKRTLDIYLLHYFYLSCTNLKDVFPFFAEHNLPLLEFTISLIIATIVITASLFTSSILRADCTLAHYLFGAKKK